MTTADLPASGGVMPILPAKLAPPEAPPGAVQRDDVCERVFAAGSARLVLFRAPAGFGKTTAMLQTRQRMLQAGLPAAWLALDAGDNDVGRFLSALVAALSSIVPGVAALAATRGRQPDELALAIVERVAVHPAPFVLFFDDFEAVQNPAVMALVAELLEQLPRGAQIVVGSRVVPDLGLGRLRARGRLLEVDPVHLRFSEPETDQFLRQTRQLPLRAEDVHRLHLRTEGWAAALWLASVALVGRDRPADYIAGFSGSNAAVVDYLVEDVLARQDDEVRGFLLRSSVLTELTAEACAAVCGMPDSDRLLQRLEAAHLFLLPVDSAQGRYRYHGMFAEFLRAQLARRLPAEVPRLHRAAADWFLRAGRPVPAIHHALQADDRAYALELMAQHAQPLLDQGRVRLLARWLDPLHEADALAGWPMLRVFHAWAVCFTRGAREAAALLDGIERSGVADARVAAHVAVMRPLVLSFTDQPEAALPLAQTALPTLPPDMGFAPAFLEVTLANLMLITGRVEEAVRFADAARARQANGTPGFNFVLSQAAAAAADLVQGRLRKALAGLRIAAGAGTREGSTATAGNALVGVPLAQALYEAGQVEQAERLLSIYIPLIRHVAIPDQLIIAHVLMARIVALRGDADRAEDQLSVLEHIGHREQLPRVVACARLERVRLLLLAERTDAAATELQRCGDAALWARVAGLTFQANEVETLLVAQARRALGSGQAGQVVKPLRAALEEAQAARRHRRALTLRLLLCVALVRDGQPRRGMRLLADTVREAAAEGYVRAFLDEGPQVTGLLADLRSSGDAWQADPGGEGVAAFLDTLLGLPGAPATPAPAAVATGTADELLTRKELQVLRQAAEGLTNEEIAEKLFVAVTTVRTHLRNINVKLDARSRIEAVANARKRGLID